MRKLLLRLMIFAAILEGLGRVQLIVIVVGLMTAIAALVCLDLLLAGRADSA